VQDPLYNNTNDDKLQSYFDEINEMRRSAVPNNTNDSVSIRKDNSHVISTETISSKVGDLSEGFLVGNERESAMDEDVMEKKRKADSDLGLFANAKKHKNENDATREVFSTIDSTFCHNVGTNNGSLNVNDSTSGIGVGEATLEVNDSELTLKQSVLRECPDCKIKDPSLYDPKPEELFLYLHAYCYFSTDFSYKTKLPAWAAMAKLTKTDIDINEITNFDKLFTKQEEL
jgi:hypothetical protein